MPVLGGFNEVSVSAGYNAAANLSSGLSDSPLIPSGGWLLRLVERGTFQLSPTMSMMVAGVLQFDNKDGSPDGSADSSLGNTWVSFGARPVFMLGKYTGVAVEGGADITRSQASGASLNVLTKLTVAGLIRPANDFWARPELRVFVTGAVWNTPARDLARSLNSPIGGAAFVNDTAGLTAGVQAESWW
jgi:maltoporin